MRLVKVSNQKRVIVIGTYILAILISIVYFVLQSTDLYNELSNIVVTIVSGLATLTAYLIAKNTDGIYGINFLDAGYSSFWAHFFGFLEN
ncbi:MAG: hypothetical protein QXP55_03130 [Nitrososphaerales archaeon]